MQVGYIRKIQLFTVLFCACCFFSFLFAEDENPSGKANLTGFGDVSPGTVGAGESLVCTLYVVNDGFDISNSGSVDFFWSAGAPSFDMADRIKNMAMYPMVRNGIIRLQFTFDVPLYPSGGAYWLSYNVDSTDTTDEGNELDNRGVFAVSVEPSGEHDTDSDLMSDAAEAVAGTDPESADSIFEIASIEKVGEDIVLSWHSVVGREYLILDEEGDQWGWYPASPPMNVSTVCIDRASARLRLRVR